MWTRRRLGIRVVMLAALALAPRAGTAASAEEVDHAADAAMEQLFAHTPVAKTLAAEAKGVLVFPTVAKAGFVYAGEVGLGVLHEHKKRAGYYNLSEVSYGFQAGVEKFSYALFFMTEEARAHLDKAGGFAIGAGPSITLVDRGFSGKLSTRTARSDVYAFVWGQEGLMGGIGLDGSKITRVDLK